MIAENKAEFDKAGITAWHEAGYLGQGVTIAVMDADPYITDYMKAEGVYFDPMGVDDGHSKDGHTAAVARVIHEVAPKATIHMFPHLSGVGYVKSNIKDYQLINHSMSAMIDKDLYSLNVPVTQASANSGGDDGWKGDIPDSVIIVGAWEEYREGRASYSSGGPGLTCMGYTNINIPTKYEGRYHSFNGTSCAAPFVCGMLALLMSKVGPLDGKTCKKFVEEHCRDLQEPGKDLDTGYGLFVLPPPEEVEGMKIIMTLGVKKAIVDGKEVELDVPPFAKDGRTLVPIRFVSEALGCKVDYNAKTKTVTIEK